MNYNIAIDGPAGAGKSTIARRIAKELNFIYVDTGSMYRAVSHAMLGAGVSPEDKEAVKDLCQKIDITLSYENGEQQVILNGENVTPYLRTEAIGNMTSVVATNGDVRKKMVELQQKLAASENVVMDGRDIGTCVLPNADLKVYLTASVETRAMRRYKELTEKQISCDIADIEKDIMERDQRDMNREISPLKQAEDAILVDSSEMNIDQVVAHIIGLFQNVK